MMKEKIMKLIQYRRASRRGTLCSVCRSNPVYIGTMCRTCAGQ